MLPNSYGTKLVWKGAVRAAHYATYDEILPGHFLIALCEACDSRLTVLYDDGPESLAFHLPAMQAEIARVRCALDALELDRASFCREMYNLLGRPGRPRPADNKLHRTDGAKQRFAAASCLAETEGASSLQPVHLLLALVDTPDVEWQPILLCHGLTPERLRRAIDRTGGSAA